MNIGNEIPFRRSRFSRQTGSLILDRQRDAYVRRQGQAPAEPMRVWSNGRFCIQQD